LVIFKHRGNLQRLLDGTEPRFAFSKSEDMSE
jgi:glycerol-3-phosphate acyltransferase PlsY